MTSRRKFLKVSIAAVGALAIACPSSGVVLPDALDVHLSTDGTNYVLKAIDLILKQEHIPGSGALTILADTVVINSALSLPGRSITVLARNITFASGGKIITSGSATTETYTGQVAATGRAPGQPGDLGRNGGKGMDGGQVRLFADSFIGTVDISAEGANGGDAESGGNGAGGEAGRPWTNYGETTAGNGSNGGTPGAPGTPGDGGNGGHVSIATLVPKGPEPKTNTRALGGRSGASARPGKPGAGGGPGAGGSYIQEVGNCA